MALNISDLYSIKNGDTGKVVAEGIQSNFSSIVDNLNLKVEWTSTSTDDYPNRKSLVLNEGDTISLLNSGGRKDILSTGPDGDLAFGEESLKLRLRSSDSMIAVNVFGSDITRYLAFKDEITSTSLVGTLEIPAYFIEDGYDVSYYPSMNEDIFNSFLNVVSIDGEVYPYPGLTYEEGKAYVVIVKRGDLENPHRTMLVSRDSDSLGFFGKLIFSLYDSLEGRISALENPSSGNDPETGA